MISQAAPGSLRPSAAQRKRHDAIYSALRTRISLLDYAPGERLSEEALADEFRVSRTPIRRVLARLEAEGLLRSVQGVGTIVTDLQFDSLAQVYALRMELAELIGRLDPAPRSDAGPALAAFRATLEDCNRLSRRPDTRGFAEANIRFFEALMELTRNQPLRAISRRLYYQTTRIWISSLKEADLAEEMEIFRREAADVIAAVELGDLDAVGHIRRSHISMSFNRLRAKGHDPLPETE